MVHGGVDALEKRAGINGPTESSADADAGGDGNFAVSGAEGRRECGDYLGGDEFGLCGIVEVGDKDDELIAADARDGCRWRARPGEGDARRS